VKKEKKKKKKKTKHRDKKGDSSDDEEFKNIDQDCDRLLADAKWKISGSAGGSSTCEYYANQQVYAAFDVTL
jgi:hypothetical protein